MSDEEDDIVKAVRRTGIWTSGVAWGAVQAVPPILLIAGMLGVTLTLVRGLIWMKGKGGVN